MRISSESQDEIVRIRNNGCGNDWPKVWNVQLNELCDAYETLRALLSAQPDGWVPVADMVEIDDGLSSNAVLLKFRKGMRPPAGTILYVAAAPKEAR